MRRAALAIALGAMGCAAAPRGPTEAARASNPDELFCEEVVYVRHAPRCLSEVSPEAQGRRASTYRLRSRGGKVVSLDRVNGSGRLVDVDPEDASELASWAFDYGDGPIPTEIRALNGLGVVVSRELVSADGTELRVVDAEGRPARRRGSKVTREVDTFDANGFVAEERFLNARDRPTMNAHRAWGYAFTRAEGGLATTITTLGPKGEPIGDKDGVVVRRVERDDRGRPTKSAFEDARHAPMLAANGRAAHVVEYDADGNTIAWAGLGLDGKPRATGEGYASITYERDARGNVARLTFLDAAGAPVRHGTFGASSIQSAHDARGNEISRAFADPSGRPAYGPKGFAKVETTYDAADRPIDARLSGPSGEPVVGADVYARWTIAYDARGNVIEWRYFDTVGRPMRTIEGHAIERRTYDAADRMTEQAYFDPNEKPVRGSAGWAKAMTTWAEDGRSSETRYFGPDGAPTHANTGESRVTKAYDELGEVSVESTFDEEGRPIGRSGGVATTRTTSDDNGDAVEVAFFDAAGAPIDSEGRATERSVIDVRGKVLSTEITRAKGVATVLRTTYAYDAWGRELERRAFGEGGRPVLSPDGWAARIRTWDDRGELASERYLGVDDTPILGKEGVAGYTYSHDAAGRVTERHAIGLDGAAALNESGWAHRATGYDAWGRIVEETFKDVHGELVVTTDGAAIFRYAFDPRGNMTSFRVFGTNRKPSNIGEKGYHGWLQQFDVRGNGVRTAWLDTTGAVSTHFLTTRSVYDLRDKPIEVTYFDSSNERALMSDLYAIRRMRNDDRGQKIEEAYFDPAGEPTKDGSGVAMRRFAYDRTGDLVEERCFDKDEAPVDNAAGWSVRRIARGEAGSVVTYLDRSGHEVTPPPDKQSDKPSPKK